MTYSIFTVSRHDVYDYLRCPKIVSLRTYKNLTKPKSKPKKIRERNIPYEIGTIGEVLTQKVFSENKENKIFSKFEEEIDKVSTEEVQEEEFDMDIQQEVSDYRLGTVLEQPQFVPIKLDLQKRGVELDAQMNNVLKNTLLGLGKIKKYLNEEYGEIKIIGHGESRNGILPNKIKPDFIGISEKNKPLMIEVKNTATSNIKMDNFQASFYNTVVKKYGAIVLEERMEDDIQTIIPKVINDPISETILVYPRQGKFSKSTETIDLDKKLVKNVWHAKQLGLEGKSPKTDCDSSCSHHRHGELPEGNLEPAIPLALIYSEGLIEQNTDLDERYLRSYLCRVGLGNTIHEGLWDIESAQNMTRFRTHDKNQIYNDLDSILKKKNKFLDEISEKTGFTRQEIDKITKIEPGYYARELKQFEKDMSNELEPWKKLIGKKNFKRLRVIAKGQSTKLYPLPKDSEGFVRRSWKGWN